MPTTAERRQNLPNDPHLSSATSSVTRHWPTT